MGGTGSFEGIEGTVDVVTITGSTGPIPLVESPSYDSYMYRTWYVAKWLCGYVEAFRRKNGVLTKDSIKGYNTIDWPVMNQLKFETKASWSAYRTMWGLQKLNIAQLNNEPVQLGFVSFGKTVLKIVVKSNIPLPVAP